MKTEVIMGEVKKVGRPRKPIDFATVEKLANIFCTREEIATFIGISLSKAEKDEEFMRVYKIGLQDAKSSLRRMQFGSAQKGNVAMQIWLGKQYLGQKEPKQDIEMKEIEEINTIRNIIKGKAYAKSNSKN